jgi:hypothetical protein
VYPLQTLSDSTLLLQLETPDAIPEFKVNGASPHPPLKFCIAVAGFRPRGEKIDALLEEGIATPTVHVIGVGDQIVVPERIQSLNDVCKDLRIEKHEGGMCSFIKIPFVCASES